MPKGRHLKAEFFTDKHIVALTPLSRLLYQGLWCYSHDCGHQDDEPIEIKMRILPADNCDVDALLDELVWHKRIERKDGVIFLPKLRDHGRIDKRYESFCEACKEAKKHGGDTPGQVPPETPITAGPHRDHAVTTQGAHRDHDADGDGDGDGDGERKGAAKRTHHLPNDFAPNDANRKIADERGLDLDSVVAQFSDHHRAKGTTYKDWHLALNTWLRREKPSTSTPPRVRDLPHASEIRRAPGGMTDEQYEAWLREGS